MNQITATQIEQSLQRLLAVAEHPRALAIRPDDRATLHQAVQRVHAQLLGQADAVLTIALAGCTGSGKSTLINALAGSPIANTSDRRPCTTQTRVYHHRQVPAGGLPHDLADQATFVAHDRPELRQKVIVDTPDLDTFHTEHRAATRALLKAAGLVIYVFSPERYVEERAWSVIREEQRFSACLAVLNKSDTIAPDALQRIAAEIRQRFTEMGQPDIPVLCISAAHHVSALPSQRQVAPLVADPPAPKPPSPDPASSPASRAAQLATTSSVAPLVADPPAPKPPSPTLDEFLTLRAFIEHELQSGDIARMIHQQRLRVLDHLDAQVQRLIPPDTERSLDALGAAATDRSRATSDDLAADLQDRLAAIEADLYPLIVVRKHQRFWGPFRTWLAITDFLRYGLPRLIRQLRLLTLPTQEGTSGRLLPAGKANLVTDRLRQQAQQLQTFLFDKGLPVERWRTITAEIDGNLILTTVARTIEDRYEALAASAYRRGAVFPWLISFIAWLLPAALIVFAAYTFVRQYIDGVSPGLNVIWDYLGMLVLSYLLLHMLTGATSSGRSLLPRRSIAAQALDETLRQTFSSWTQAYRTDLQADITDLREPLALLRLAAQGTIIRAAENLAPPATPATMVPDQPSAPAPQEQPAAPPPAQSPTEPPLTAAELLRRSMQSGKSHKGKD